MKLSKQTGTLHLQFVITTSELDFAGEGKQSPLLAASKKQRFSETLDMAELLSKFDGATVEPVTLTPTDVGFLTYTSGTTGLPNVEHPQRRLLLRWPRDTFISLDSAHSKERTDRIGRA